MYIEERKNSVIVFIIPIIPGAGNRILAFLSSFGASVPPILAYLSKKSLLKAGAGTIMKLWRKFM
jgi:hypothetical protein